MRFSLSLRHTYMHGRLNIYYNIFSCGMAVPKILPSSSIVPTPLYCPYPTGSKWGPDQRSQCSSSPVTKIIWITNIGPTLSSKRLVFFKWVPRVVILTDRMDVDGPRDSRSHYSIALPLCKRQLWLGAKHLCSSVAEAKFPFSSRQLLARAFHFKFLVIASIRRFFLLGRKSYFYFTEVVFGMFLGTPKSKCFLGRPAQWAMCF